MAKAGISTRSEALEIKDFRRLIDGLHNDEEYRWELFCVLSYSLALRISDVLNLKWQDLLGRDHCTVEEIKTKKIRRIPLEEATLAKVAELHILMGRPTVSEHIFLNRKKGVVYTPQYVNQKLKQFRVWYRLPIRNFSSHTFRKTFGRQVYNTNGQSEHSILLINRALRHSSIDTTIVYLGLKQDEVNGIYKQAAI